MRNYYKNCLVLLLSAGWLLVSFVSEAAPQRDKKLRLPYRKAGLNKQQAAAHLISRFTYGAQPNQINEVVKLGLEKWVLLQMDAKLPNEALENRLSKYKSQQKSNAQITGTYVTNGQLLRRAVKDGIITQEVINKGESYRPENRKKLDEYMKQKGLQPQSELFQEIINQKILRAAYSRNQLQEVLASFWFNHFNVSITKEDCSPYITTFERDIIRPNVFSPFETLLMATAKSPAMLTYLDNFKNTGADAKAIANETARLQRTRQELKNRPEADTTMEMNRMMERVNVVRAANGLNENYAREIMELHTLGVDAGYTQADVTHAAKILTGWAVRVGANTLPDGSPSPHPGFFFNASRHDQSEKIVLGTRFPAGGGVAEGEQLIKLLAHHPATAKFIATKLAIRFVNDKPATSLVDKMAKTFLEKDGDIRQVLLTMVASPEFWSKEALREKTKSPFELAMSSVRSLNADIQAPYQLYNWITRMGEKMYYYQAPTGFPDRGQYWINTGSLLNRMNFALALVSHQIPGTTLNLAALNKNREPESAQAALAIYSKYLLPERDLKETINRLTPLLQDPEYSKKIKEAEYKTVQRLEPVMRPERNEDMMIMSSEAPKERRPPEEMANQERKDVTSNGTAVKANNPMLAQVVGIIIGSPEFQRR